MSGAAELYVETLPLKGSARDLLRIIARHIPDGQTTTPIIRIADLAAAAQLHRRTVLKWVGELVDSGEITVMDGGRGKKARFTLVHLTGARPMVAAPLPLRADLRPVPPPRPRLDDATGDLFTEAAVASEDPAIKRVVIDHTLPPNVWRSITRWPKRVVIDHTLTTERVIDPSVLTTARDVLPLKETTTTTAPPGDPPRPRAVESPPCRSFGTAHAWCHGRQHVPMNFHREERRRLARSPGETDADLDARLFARYAEILAGIPDAEPILDRNEFEFWKRVMRSAPRAVPSRPRAPADVRVPKCRGDHEPACSTTDDCIARTLADARAERERQTG